MLLAAGADGAEVRAAARSAARHHGRIDARHVHRPAAEIACLEAPVLGERRRGHDSGDERDEHHRRLPHSVKLPCRCRPDPADTAHQPTSRVASPRDVAEPPACAIRTARSCAMRRDRTRFGWRLRVPRQSHQHCSVRRADRPARPAPSRTPNVRHHLERWLPGSPRSRFGPCHSACVQRSPS